MDKPKDPRKQKAAFFRAAKLSPERRRAIAIKAVRARWARASKGSKARSAAGVKSWETRRARVDYIQWRSAEPRLRLTRRKRPTTRIAKPIDTAGRPKKRRGGQHRESD